MKLVHDMMSRGAASAQPVGHFTPATNGQIYAPSYFSQGTIQGHRPQAFAINELLGKS